MHTLHLHMNVYASSQRKVCKHCTKLIKQTKKKKVHNQIRSTPHTMNNKPAYHTPGE